MKSSMNIKSFMSDPSPQTFNVFFDSTAFLIRDGITLDFSLSNLSYGPYKLLGLIII